MNKRLSDEELRLFAWDVYYKAITLISKDDQQLIDIDDEIVKELVKTTLHSKGDS